MTNQTEAEDTRMIGEVAAELPAGASDAVFSARASVNPWWRTSGFGLWICRRVFHHQLSREVGGRGAGMADCA
jgi:hypothetical protein